MAEQHTRRRTSLRSDAGPAECRCPEGWPVLAARFVEGVPVREHKHHPADCGLPPTTEGERPA